MVCEPILLLLTNRASSGQVNSRATGELLRLTNWASSGQVNSRATGELLRLANGASRHMIFLADR